MTGNVKGPDLTAETLDAVHRAKSHIMNLREQEKKALKNVSAAQVLKKSRKKGGADAMRKAESALAQVGQLKSEAVTTLKRLEQEQLDLEETVRGPTTSMDTSLDGGRHMDKENEKSSGQEEDASANSAAGNLGGTRKDLASGEPHDEEKKLSAGQQEDANSAAGNSGGARKELTSGEPLDIIMKQVDTDHEGHAEDKSMKLISDSDKDELDATAAQASGGLALDGDIPMDGASDHGEEEGKPVPKAKNKKVTYADNRAKENARIKNKFLSSNDKGKMELSRKVDDAIAKYIDDPNKYPISGTLKDLIRRVQGVGRKASNYSRDLALHVMESNKGNMICPYHREKERLGLICDLNPGSSEYQVTGTPFERQVVTSGGTERVRRKGIFDCGCTEDDVLLDFYWWKSISATSASTNETEGWSTQRLDPRARLFMRVEWEYISGLVVDDIYRHGKRRWETEVKRCTTQIETLTRYREAAKLNVLKDSNVRR